MQFCEVSLRVLPFSTFYWLRPPNVEMARPRLRWRRCLSRISAPIIFVFFFSSRRRHTRFKCDWSSDVCSSDLKAGIRETGIGGVGAAVEASVEGQAAIDAVFRVGVHAKRMLRLKKSRDRKRELVTRAPEELGAEQEGIVDSAAQRLPAECRVSAIQISQKVRAVVVVAARVGHAEIEVGGFGQVAIGAQVADDADILATAGLEDIRRITAQYLCTSFEEPVLTRGQKPREEEAGIVDAGLAAD